MQKRHNEDRKWLYVCLVSVAILLAIFLGTTLGWRDTNICSTFSAYNKKVCVEPPTTIVTTHPTTKVLRVNSAGAILNDELVIKLKSQNK